MQCVGCEKDFEAATFRGYCPDCQQTFKDEREHVHARTYPAPGVHQCGKFAKGKSPVTVTDPVLNVEVCGLCGSAEVESGYGFGGGYGLGSYVFCNNCNAFLNFVEDRE